MNLRSFLLTCAAAFAIVGNSQAAYYSGLNVSYSYSGTIVSSNDSTSGTQSNAGQNYGVLIMTPDSSKGISLSGAYTLGYQGTDTILSFTAQAMTGGALNQFVEFSFTTTIEFTLDTAISASAFRNAMGYNSGPYAGTYTMTVNGDVIPFNQLYSTNLLEGLNTIVLTGSLTSPSLAYDLNETGGGAILFAADPAPVPEPGSWALIAFGTGTAFVAARRKASRTRASLLER